MSFQGSWGSCHLWNRLVECRQLCPFIFLSICRTAWQQSFTHQEEIKSLNNCLFSVLFSSLNVSRKCFHPSVFSQPGRKMDNGWWCGWQSAWTLKLMKRRENLIRKALQRPQHYEKSQINTHTYTHKWSASVTSLWQNASLRTWHFISLLKYSGKIAHT